MIENSVNFIFLLTLWWRWWWSVNSVKIKVNGVVCFSCRAAKGPGLCFWKRALLLPRAEQVSPAQGHLQQDPSWFWPLILSPWGAGHAPAARHRRARWHLAAAGLLGMGSASLEAGSPHPRGDVRGPRSPWARCWPVPVPLGLF